MKKVVILAAISALPLGATAQPPSNSDISARADQAVSQAQEATTAPEIVVKTCAMPADSEGYSTRSKRHVANQEFDASPHPINGNKERPGTRDFILRSIADFRIGTADFDHMSGAIAQITRENLAVEKLWISCRGNFKNISFLHVSQDGFDDFEVDFAGAAIEWEVDPLDAHQKTRHWAARFYYPEPMTGQFDGFLQSVESGRPDYRRLAPEFALTFKQQWPALLKSSRRWHGPHSLVFLKREEDGSYKYKVAYGDHVVIWTVSALDTDQKISGLIYEEAT